MSGEIVNNNESSAVDAEKVEVASVDNATSEKMEISESEKIGDEKEHDSKRRKITRRGMGFTPPEDMMVCKSWVEVKKECPKSRGEDLAEKMLKVYETYRTQDIETGNSPNALPLRSSVSIFQRFRRVIVPSVIELYSIVNVTQNNDVEKQEYWDRLMKRDNSVARHHFAFKDCYHFLLSSPQFQITSYKKGSGDRGLSISTGCVEPEKSAKVAAATPSPSKKVKISSVVAAKKSIPSLPFLETAPMASNSTSSPSRLFFSRGGKSMFTSLRGGAHASRRMIHPTGDVFQDELLRYVSNLVDNANACFTTLVFDRSDDSELKNMYKNALTRQETLRHQEDSLRAESHDKSLLEKSKTMGRKVENDLTSPNVDCEKRVQFQEQFWLGEDKKGSMKHRLEVLEIFINGETSGGSFLARLESLERMSGRPI